MRTENLYEDSIAILLMSRMVYNF